MTARRWLNKPGASLVLSAVAVAVAWQRLSAGDWANYAAEFSHRASSSHQSEEGTRAPR
ncbi:hypothetical protein ACFW1M_31600 [Streptomyces inhibens]|uniref:hypothetical protein n=1 Tax=Streptomyces inhibens TaxID=2293571 RepID=UPI0036B6E799